MAPPEPAAPEEQEEQAATRVQAESVERAPRGRPGMVDQPELRAMAERVEPDMANFVRRRGLAAALLAALSLSVSLSACDFGVEGANGTDCTKNNDCESKHCISNKCRPQPSFGGGSAGTSSGSAGSGGSAGSAGATDAGAD